MVIPKKPESEQQIGLELPDYSQEYYEYIKKKEIGQEKEETVVIIDIY
jgi:hypothetical protein